MSDIEAEVHVYASGREFVVVPVLSLTPEEVVEAAPAEHVNLVIGRATVVELSRALRAAQQQCLSASSVTACEGHIPWDGDTGRWWAHNLLFVVLRWCDGKLEFIRQARTDGSDWEAVETTILPAETSFTDLAEELIRALGDRLHR